MNSLFGFDIFRQALSAGQSLSAPLTNKNSGAGPATGFGSPPSTSVTRGPVQVNAILRALYGNDRVSIENAPLVVTEDNEPANVKRGYQDTNRNQHRYGFERGNECCEPGPLPDRREG